MRVLFADDEEGLRRSLDRWLRSWGYDVLVASDGVEAWRLLKHEAKAPRLVILDWDMPGLSGVEVCRLLRSTPHGADVYVIMLTAKQQKDDVISALESGADDFLSKPFHPRELQLRLAKGVRDAARRPAPPSVLEGTPPAATVLGGKYRLERRLAKGGMGSVWLGVHLSLGINVAIKFMDPSLAETADYASFEREARAAAQLRSANVVRVYDHGIDGQGLPYLVMEYLQGEELADRIVSHGPLALDDVVAVIEQAARALTEAHGRGLIHRDIKPENLLLVEDHEQPEGFTVKLIDFGLVNPRDQQHADDNQIAGTPSYMSPEYMAGGRAPDVLLDLWGLAATAFVAATGTLAFDGKSAREIYRRLVSEPPPVPSKVAPHLPPSFDAWFARACAREPSARFQTADELARALREACDEPSARAHAAAFRHSAVLAATEPDSGGELARDRGKTSPRI